MRLLEKPLKRPPKDSWMFSDGEGSPGRHTPVMLEEVLAYLQPSPGKVIVDGTVGEGGHSEGILGKITPDGYLIGIDQDDDALRVSRRRLSHFGEAFTLVQGNFRDIERIVVGAGFERVNGIVLDLGVSRMQLTTPERGFSFREEGPLNMRMDKRGQITAFDLVNNLSEEELANLIYRYGEERYSRRIARQIIRERQQSPVTTTSRLAEVVSLAFPPRERYRRMHPATRTFMALRIAVNRELEVLPDALDGAVSLLEAKGRLCVITFHSLEDRIVKHRFKEFAQEKRVNILTKKPLRPSPAEVDSNPPSRSAKLRVVEKI